MELTDDLWVALGFVLSEGNHKRWTHNKYIGEFRNARVSTINGRLCYTESYPNFPSTLEELTKSMTEAFYEAGEISGRQALQYQLQTLLGIDN